MMHKYSVLRFNKFFKSNGNSWQAPSIYVRITKTIEPIARSTNKTKFTNYKVYIFPYSYIL